MVSTKVNCTNQLFFQLRSNLNRRKYHFFRGKNKLWMGSYLFDSLRTPTKRWSGDFLVLKHWKLSNFTKFLITTNTVHKKPQFLICFVYKLRIIARAKEDAHAKPAIHRERQLTLFQNINKQSWKCVNKIRSRSRIIYLGNFCEILQFLA